IFFFSSRRRHTRFSRDWSSDVCSSDLGSDQADLLLEGSGARILELSEETPGRTGSNQGGRLHLSNKSELPSRLPAGTDRGRLSRSEERRVGKGAGTSCRPCY